MQHKVIDANDVVIRFAGDSGDGMQLTGSLFADMSAIYGNGLINCVDELLHSGSTWEIK